MGMLDLVFFKAEDWKKAWLIIKGRLASLDNITVGILKLDSKEVYEKELKWYLLKKEKIR